METNTLLPRKVLNFVDIFANDLALNLLRITSINVKLPMIIFIFFSLYADKRLSPNDPRDHNKIVCKTYSDEYINRNIRVISAMRPRVYGSHDVWFEQNLTMSIVYDEKYIFLYNPNHLKKKHIRALFTNEIGNRKFVIVLTHRFHHLYIDRYIDVLKDVQITGSKRAYERHGVYKGILYTPIHEFKSSTVEFLHLGQFEDEYIMTIKVRGKYVILCAHFGERVSHVLSIYKLKNNNPLYSAFMNTIDKWLNFVPDGSFGFGPVYEVDYYCNKDVFHYIDKLPIYKVVAAHGGILGDNFTRCYSPGKM
jgi:hypothetical protein